ncbi:phage major capsid protein [Bradyrhizobium sp. 41S5]|uniref:phage major capsid protein n=1 Tax=Bradyrhizobium sp. 41S5 TaxID=1404443 RepID=UPI00156B3E78|nr:phage major capsid protein [Bradyrhizobium sp. 41S5]UFX42075.1 phage major capsid protein [Bradyrhizobium sp. 41S5]
MTRHFAPRSLLSAAPRALMLPGVRADVSPAELVQGLTKDLGDFKSAQVEAMKQLEKVVNDFRAANDTSLKAKVDDAVMTEQVNRINAAIDEGVKQQKDIGAKIDKITAEIEKLTEKQASLTVLGNGTKASKDPRTSNPNLPEYAKAFNRYFRRGENAVEGGASALRDLEVKAAMSVGSDPDGGYTVLPEIEQTIDEVVQQISPMRDLATVMTIGTSEYRKLVNQHGTASGWVGEVDSRPQTAGSNLSELKFPIMEMYAMPAASQSLLDDAFVDIGAWIAGEVQLEFARQEGNAFVVGDGQNKPNGIVGGYQTVANNAYAWGKIGFVTTGAAGAFANANPADCLVDLLHSVKSPYRINSTFVANRGTLGAIRKLKDGQGNYLLNMVLRQEGFIEEILGRPAVEMPDMPDMGANSLSVAYGDFKRAYLIIDRIGIRVLRDPYTAKPYVLFYTTKRVGGGVQNFEAFKLLKFA